MSSRVLKKEVDEPKFLDANFENYKKSVEWETKFFTIATSVMFVGLLVEMFFLARLDSKLSRTQQDLAWANEDLASEQRRLRSCQDFRDLTIHDGRTYFIKESK